MKTTDMETQYDLGQKMIDALSKEKVTSGYELYCVHQCAPEASHARGASQCAPGAFHLSVHSSWWASCLSSCSQRYHHNRQSNRARDEARALGGTRARPPCVWRQGQIHQVPRGRTAAPRRGTMPRRSVLLHRAQSAAVKCPLRLYHCVAVPSHSLPRSCTASRCTRSMLSIAELRAFWRCSLETRVKSRYVLRGKRSGASLTGAARSAGAD